MHSYSECLNRGLLERKKFSRVELVEGKETVY